MRPIIEVCVEGIDGLVAAQKGGADRVELCASLVEGGITPSFGTVREALAVATIPFHVIVRPRGGDFLYSEREYRRCWRMSGACASSASPGRRRLPQRRRHDRRGAHVAHWSRRRGPLNVTCHRAFDMTRDPAEALEALVRCRVGRVLTSGQRDTAVEGAELLAALVKQAGERIIIMGCGGLDAGNIATSMPGPA